MIISTAGSICMIVANALDDNLIDGDVLDWINRKCRLRSGCFLRPFQSYAPMQSSGVIVLTLINNLKCPLMIISTALTENRSLC